MQKSMQVISALGFLVLINMMTASLRAEQSNDTRSGQLDDVIALVGKEMQSEMSAPHSVIPYSDGHIIDLANLELMKKGSNMIGTVSFKRKQEGKFTLVVYTVFEKKVITIYYDTEKRLLLAAPSGQYGNILFTMSGYNVQESNNEKEVDFEFPLKTFGVFDILDESGTVYVFFVKGEVNPRSSLPGEQKDGETFHAASNVLTANMDF